MKLLSALSRPNRKKSRRSRSLLGRRNRLLRGEALEDRRLLAALVNADFETGDLTGWHSFLTTNGTIGTPDVVQFDTDGDGTPSFAAKFKAGEVSFQNAGAGGGIYQTFHAGGEVQISADIASRFNFHGSNASGGIFSLLVNGTVVDFHDFGSIDETERSVLSADLTLPAGTHELRILMERPWVTGSTPEQFIDNVVVQALNQPPSATDDSYEVDEDNTLTVSAADGVLDNDDDPDGDSLTATSVVTAPSNGTVTLDSDGSFEYIPDPNFHGEDSFVYEVSDGNGGTDEATVEITVNSAIDVIIDVKPGSDQNPLNLSSKGVVPIAILSTQQANGAIDDFNAQTLDPNSDTFFLNGVQIDPVHAAFEDVDGDGDLDLLLHFSMEELVDEGVVDEDSTDLVLTAEYGGAAFGHDLGGSDSVRIVPPKGNGNGNGGGNGNGNGNGN